MAPGSGWMILTLGGLISGLLGSLHPANSRKRAGKTRLKYPEYLRYKEYILFRVPDL